MRRSLIVIALSGCSFHSSSSQQSSDGGNPQDASIEMHDAAAGCRTFSSYTDTCVLDLSMPMSIGNDKIYHTDTHVLADFPLGTNATTIDQQIDVDTGSGPMNLILASTLSISGSATLHVVGPKAFGVVSDAAVALDGDIDGSADLPTAFALLSPAGAVDAAGCATSTPATPATHSNGGGGGGGGGFRGNGGTGQDGDGGNAAGAVAGLPISTMPAGVRGGCPGGTGGSTSSSLANGGVGGAGGAGVYLASRVSITIHGGASINVGGGGGAGGVAGGGGGAGGGGSGGMIVLESGSISIQGTVAANGGGGGGGAGGIGGANGQSGLASSSAAAGAQARDPGGGGADGAAGNSVDGQNDTTNTPNAGGGGGGGAGGYLVLLTLNAVVGSATISPK